MKGGTSLLAKFFQAEPVHAGKNRLQLEGQPIPPQPEPTVRHHNHHLQVLHLRVQVEEASRLGKQPVLEPSLALHLHLEQHHRLLGCTELAASWPEHAIEPVIDRLQLRCLKAIQLIAGSVGPKAGRSPTRQQQRDQIRRALEQAEK